MNMRANNVICSLRKKKIEKEIRDQAKKTSVWLYKKLKYWDIDTEEPIEDKTVSLEEYLEFVCWVPANELKVLHRADKRQNGHRRKKRSKQHTKAPPNLLLHQYCRTRWMTPQIAFESAGDISQKLRPRRGSGLEMGR